MTQNHSEPMISYSNSQTMSPVTSAGPQGSILDPFFIVYLYPIGNIKIQDKLYSYPDDTQLYLTSTHAPNHSPLTKAPKLKTELENIYVNIQGHPQPHPSVSS